MADQRQASIVGVRLELLQFADNIENVLFSTLVLRQAAHIQLAGVSHERSVGRQVVLDAYDEITARSENVREKRILGILYRVALADDGDW